MDKYVIAITPKNAPAHLAGPFNTAEEVIDWIYKQIGIWKINNPEDKLEIEKWEYENSSCDSKTIFSDLERYILEVAVKIGSNSLKAILLSRPEAYLIEKEKESISEVRSGFSNSFQSDDLSSDNPF